VILESQNDEKISKKFSKIVSIIKQAAFYPHFERFTDTYSFIIIPYFKKKASIFKNRC